MSSNVSNSIDVDVGVNPHRVKRALYFAAFIDSISASIIMPFFPFLVLKFGGDARTAGFIFAMHAVLAVVSGPVFGRLSDRFGRRPALVTAFLVLTGSYLVFGLASSLLQLVIARAMAGTMSGGFGVIQAAVSDLTDRAERAKAMGFVVGASACGFAVGPVIGLVATAIDQQSSARGASLVGAALLFGCGLLLWATVPKLQGKVVHAPGSKSRGIRAFGINRSVGTRLLLTMLVVAMMQAGLTAILGFWANSALGWQERGVGWLFVWIFVTIGVNQWFVLPKILAAHAAQRVLWGAMLGILLGALGMLSQSFHIWILGLAAAVIFCGISVARTVVTSMASTVGAETDRGAALGYVSSAGYVGRAFGPVVFSFLFVEVGPRAPFIATAVIAVISLLWLFSRSKFFWATE